MDGVSIRPAQPTDSEAIALLCGQLGYPTTASKVVQRLENRSPDTVQALVALDESHKVVGWVDVLARPSLIAGLFAEINGLVVDKACRGKGIGNRLMAAAEAWAQEHDCTHIRVRSNTIRRLAHAVFYTFGLQPWRAISYVIGALCIVGMSVQVISRAL